MDAMNFNPGDVLVPLGFEENEHPAGYDIEYVLVDQITHGKVVVGAFAFPSTGFSPAYACTFTATTRVSTDEELTHTLEGVTFEFESGIPKNQMKVHRFLRSYYAAFRVLQGVPGAGR